MSAAEIKAHLAVIDTSNLVDKVERKLREIFIKKELKPGDPERFRSAMRAHLENHFQRIMD